MIKNMHVGRIEESEIKRETDMTNCIIFILYRI